MKINQKSDYLTILIGSYNRLDLLKKSIEAIRSQTSSSYEIIVVDGGSTDGTAVSYTHLDVYKRQPL